MIQKTKPFKAVSMPCTEEQFEKELSHILDFLEVKVVELDSIRPELITTLPNGISIGGKNIANYILDVFCPKTFIEALGYDYEAVIKAMQPKQKQTHYKVLRPILFFAKDNVVHKETLKKYFTKRAIKAFVKDKYIK